MSEGGLGATLAEHWPLIDGLLDELLAPPESARADWLAALPAERQALRPTLERLLAAQRRAETGGFLNSLPAVDARPEPEADAAQPGEIVGPWRLLQPLGEGGMGSVWLAERADGSLQRQVALKLPRLSWARGLAGRMARERDILATLDHPHIARLFDAGVDARGRPWLALEAVAGQPIDRHCTERQLPLRPRLELLIQVADAVAYAHGRLVVHRDLKPGNILVTAAGQAKLLDFGIAKLLQEEDQPVGSTALTQLAGRAFTPEYASPEQVRGEPLGTASDVYSLAVVAYELLTGSRPYRLTRGTAAELEAAVSSERLKPPSEQAAEPALRRALKGDLDAILLRALEPDPARRTASALEFGADLRRHLRGEPVLARPLGWGERSARFIRRHRGPVLAASAVATALVAGTGVALWQASQARAAEARARAEAATARAVQGFIESVFAANSGDQSDPASGRGATARDLLDRGSQRIASELADAPQARLRLLALMASMYEDMAVLDRALALQEQRLALATTLASARSTGAGAGEAEDARILALADVAHALSFNGRDAEGRQRLAEARAALDRRIAAGEAVPPAVPARVALREASSRLETDTERLVAAADRSLALARPLGPSVELVIALHQHADTRLTVGDAAGAAASAREASALVQADPTLGANMDTAVQSLLAMALDALGDRTGAEAAFRAALQAERRRAPPPLVLHVLELNFAIKLLRWGRPGEALELLQPALAWAETQRPPFDLTVPMLPTIAGQALLARGDVAGSLAALDRAATGAATLQGAPDVVGPIHLFRSEALADQGRLAESQAALEAGARLVEAHGTGQGRLVREALARRAEALAAGPAAGRAGEAAAALAAWRAWRQRDGLADEPAAEEGPSPRWQRARLRLALGDTAGALDDTTQALAADGLARHPDVQAGASLLQARLLLQAGRAREALTLLAPAEAHWRRAADARLSPPLALALQVRARALSQLGEPGAEAALAEARAIVARHARLGAQFRLGPAAR